MIEKGKEGSEESGFVIARQLDFHGRMSFHKVNCISLHGVDPLKGRAWNRDVYRDLMPGACCICSTLKKKSDNALPA